MKKHLQNFLMGKKILAILLVTFLVVVGILIVLRVAYLGKVYPGVSANGVHLGGLSRAEAIKLLDERSKNYQSEEIEVILPSSSTKITGESLGVVYNSKRAAEKAYEIGRQNDFLTNVSSQLYALFGQAEPINIVSLDSDKTSAFLIESNNANAKSVQNASFVVDGSNVSIQEPNKGKRIDLARASSYLANHFANLDRKEMVLPVETVEPMVSSHSLLAHRDLFVKLVSNPILLQAANKSWKVDANLAASWLSSSSNGLVDKKDILTRHYSLKTSESSVFFDKKIITNYISSLASDVNIEAVDAKLTIAGGKAVVFAQSRDGRTLQVEPSAAELLTVLNTSQVTKPISLSVVTTKADVSDGNIENLGIKELISEGVSYFPGSSAERLQNVRAGAKRFNGVLVKPGQIFSFGENLGEVGPEQGYAKSKVILDGRQEYEYGGGLCQVSSTAYRAALLAGLPITQRTNHAFAISYYTAPYGTPGVDATIYYPAVDMKFKNDTPHYILIQTQMSGTTLKFSFYGTKQKEGKIRGPFYEFGSSDFNQPSKTVFYRDIMDLSGNITKTDTVSTYYKSALDYPSSN